MPGRPSGFARGEDALPECQQHPASALTLQSSWHFWANSARRRRPPRGRGAEDVSSRSVRRWRRLGRTWARVWHPPKSGFGRRNGLKASRDGEAKSDHACRSRSDWKLIEMGANPHGSEASRTGKKNPTKTDDSNKTRVTMTHTRTHTSQPPVYYCCYPRFLG